MRRSAHPLLAAVLIGIFCTGLLFLALSGLYRDEQFDQSTLRSQATVEHYWTTTGNKGSTHYHVRYHFQDEFFRQWIVNTAVARGTYARLQVGDVVPVKYLEDEPVQSRIDWPEEDQYHWRQDEILLCVGLLIGGFTALIFFSKSS
jgi:hypothetical protein